MAWVCRGWAVRELRKRARGRGAKVAACLYLWLSHLQSVDTWVSERWLSEERGEGWERAEAEGASSLSGRCPLASESRIDVHSITAKTTTMIQKGMPTRSSGRPGKGGSANMS
eukprot:2475800-Rhodomonas_salina.2